MALLSYNLIEEILGVAERYAEQEKARLSRLDNEGHPISGKQGHPKTRRRTRKPPAQSAD